MKFQGIFISDCVLAVFNDDKDDQVLFDEEGLLWICSLDREDSEEIRKAINEVQKVNIKFK